MESPFQNVISSDHTHLFLDASSVTVQAGLWHNGQWLAYRAAQAPALESIFVLVRDCLDDAGLGMEDVKGFLHCEGPGSVLGIRLAAMAIRAWRALPDWHEAPVFACRSLPLVAALIRHTREPEADFHLIAESRQTRWNHLTSTAPKTVEEVEPEALEALTPPVYHLRQRKAWHEPPEGAIAITSDLRTCPELISQPGLFIPTDAPDLYQVNAPSFKTWTPERHRA